MAAEIHKQGFNKVNIKLWGSIFWTWDQGKNQELFTHRLIDVFMRAPEHYALQLNKAFPELMYLIEMWKTKDTKEKFFEEVFEHRKKQ